MTKKDIKSKSKIEAEIYMPTISDLKYPPGMENYYSVDCEKLPGIIKYTSFNILMKYTVEEGSSLPDNLPGKPLEKGKKPGQQGVHFTKEVLEWMKTQPAGKVYASAGRIIFFEKEEDLSWFLLRFGSGNKK